MIHFTYILVDIIQKKKINDKCNAAMENNDNQKGYPCIF